MTIVFPSATITPKLNTGPPRRCSRRILNRMANDLSTATNNMTNDICLLQESVQLHHPIPSSNKIRITEPPILYHTNQHHGSRHRSIVKYDHDNKGPKKQLFVNRFINKVVILFKTKNV